MAAHAHVTCPACGASMAAQDISLSTLSARCPACHALVDLRGTTADARQGIPAAAEPLPVPMPAGMQVLDQGRDLTIVRRWFSWVYLFLVVFCVPWMGFLVFWYSFALRPGMPLVVKLFPLAHVAVGLWLCYFTAAGFLNRTTIRIDRDHLTIRHGPLPWPGSVEIPGTALEQLFCTERYNSRRTHAWYAVEAVLKDGRNLKLVRHLNSREQAMFIEQSIERHLGIADRRVRSEMPV